MSQSIQPELLLGDVLTYIDQVEKLLAAGNTADLKTFDETVDALSLQLGQLTPVQLKEYAPEIEHLAERMTALTKTMEELRDKAGEHMTTVTSHHRAVKAYLSTPES